MYLTPQRATKKNVSIYPNDDNLKPDVKIGTPSGHAVLNDMQLFILLTLKGDNSRMKCTNLVTHNISCLCTLDGISASRARTLNCI